MYIRFCTFIMIFSLSLPAVSASLMPELWPDSAQKFDYKQEWLDTGFSLQLSPSGQLTKEALAYPAHQETYILDHPASESVPFIKSELFIKASASGFKTIADCQNTGCGQVEQWRNYLGSLFKDSGSNQAFITLVAESQTRIIQIYLTEVGCCVRSYWHQINILPATLSAREQELLKSGRIQIAVDRFTTNSSQLSESSELKLNGIAQWLSDSGYQAWVVGHTDYQGKESYNMGLAEDRAKSVINYLVANGVPESTLHLRSVGSLAPVADNSSAIGRAQNRRVELVIRPLLRISSATNP